MQCRGAAQESDKAQDLAKHAIGSRIVAVPASSVTSSVDGTVISVSDGSSSLGVATGDMVVGDLGDSLGTHPGQVLV
jgi:hypothetical protein